MITRARIINEKARADLSVQRASDELLTSTCDFELYDARAARRGAARRPRPARGAAFDDLRRGRARSRALVVKQRSSALIDAPFDGRRRFAHHFGDFRDDEELGAIEHALLAEREALRLGEEREALEHVGHFVDRAAAHLVGVVLEAPFPVLVVVDLAVAEQAEQPLDFFVADGAAQADAVDVAHRHEHGRFVGDDAEMIETAGGAENGFLFDAFDDPETMIRVNDLVADFKCHGSPC